MLKKHLSDARVNKGVLIRNVILFWVSLYLAIPISALFKAFINSAGNIGIQVLEFPLVYFLSFYLLSYILYHIMAKYNLKKGILFSSSSCDGWLARRLTPTKVRKGTLVSIQLACYLREVCRKEWGNKLCIFVLTQKCSVERPLILRSHLLSLQATRNQLIKQLKKQGFNCSVNHDLPIEAKFRLLWLTPALIAAFQLYLPTLCDRETEIIIMPATSTPRGL